MATKPEDFLNINAILLSSLGLWPYQNKYQKLFFFASAIFFLTTQGYLQTAGCLAALVDIPIFLESIAPVLISIMCVIKFLNFIYNADKMKHLIDTVKNDWKIFKDPAEVEILRNWSEDSRKSSWMYASAVYGSMVPLMFGPAVPPLLSLIPDSLIHISRNITDAKPIMFHVEYYIDMDKYYRPLIVHSFFGTLTYVTVVVAIDCIFMTYVQRACAMFNIVGYRLGKLVDGDSLDVNINPYVKNDEPYRRIIECIITHSKAIEYARLVEEANSTSFLLQLCINMVTISFTGLQAATKLDRPVEAFRYATFTIAQTFHLFFESWPSQRLVDESTRLTEYTINAPWYNISLKSRKLLQMLIMKSMEPCQLTAGGFYSLNMENFSAVVKTSMSYFTVLSSTT